MQSAGLVHLSPSTMHTRRTTQLKLNPPEVVNHLPNWTSRAFEDVLDEVLEAMAEVLSSSDRVVAQQLSSAQSKVAQWFPQLSPCQPALLTWLAIRPLHVITIRVMKKVGGGGQCSLPVWNGSPHIMQEGIPVFRRLRIV